MPLLIWPSSRKPIFFFFFFFWGGGGANNKGSESAQSGQRLNIHLLVVLYQELLQATFYFSR